MNSWPLSVHYSHLSPYCAFSEMSPQKDVTYEQISTDLNSFRSVISMQMWSYQLLGNYANAGGTFRSQCNVFGSRNLGSRNFVCVRTAQRNSNPDGQIKRRMRISVDTSFPKHGESNILYYLTIELFGLWRNAECIVYGRIYLKVKLFKINKGQQLESLPENPCIAGFSWYM